MKPTSGDGLSAYYTKAAKSATGYVGLYNPSCLCYMNSSNQQFFMVSV